MTVERLAEDQKRGLNLSTQIEGDEVDLLEIVRTVWRGKWFIAFVTLIAICLGAFYAYKIAVPKYTASAAVTLENRQQNIADMASVVSGLSGDQATINTEVEVLQSRGLIEKLVARMSLQDDPEFNTRLRPDPLFSVAKARALVFGKAEASTPSEQQIIDSTVNAVLGVVSISNVRSSYVFSIKAVTTNAAKSAEIVNTLAELYIIDQIEVKFAATERATKWLSERVVTLQSELEQAEFAVQELSARTALVSREALEVVNRQIKNNRDRLSDVNAQVVVFAARVAELTEAGASGDRTRMSGFANDAVLDQLYAANASDAAFNARFELVQDRAQIELARAQARSASLSQAIAALEDEFAAQSEDFVQLQQLEREAEASRLIYEFFLARLKETSVQEGIQQADSRILSRAAVPGGASEPRKSLVLGLSAMLGLMVGAGLVLLREMLHDTFRTAEELEAKSGYSVMGQIPLIPAKKRGGVIGYLVDKPTSAAAEAVRNLRTSILLSNVDRPPRVIMITSSVPSEGKTTASLALANNFAGLGRKVLLIEGDVRRRVFGEYFDLPPSKGIVSVVSGEATIDEAVQRSNLMNVDIMVADQTAINPADFFSSASFAGFIKDARARYDVVIIDTAPVLVVPDARIIAQVADAVMYAVAWDQTSTVQVKEGLRQFEAGNIRVTGLVMGKIDPKGMKRYGLADGYGAYSSYGSDYYAS